jgi:hypothetical protein
MAATERDVPLGTLKSMQQSALGQGRAERDALNAIQRDRNKLHLCLATMQTTRIKMLGGLLGAPEKISPGSALVRERDDAWRTRGSALDLGRGNRSACRRFSQRCDPTALCLRSIHHVEAA